MYYIAFKHNGKLSIVQTPFNSEHFARGMARELLEDEGKNGDEYLVLYCCGSVNAVKFLESGLLIGESHR